MSVFQTEDGSSTLPTRTTYLAYFMNKSNPFKKLSSRIAYKNPWLRIREDTIVRPNGDDGLFGVVETHDSVMIVAVNNMQEICIENIFRYPVQKWVWELPMGSTGGQDDLEAGQRELKEEVGITAESWQIIGRHRVCPGLMYEYQTVMIATGLLYGEPTDADEGIAGHKFVSLAQAEEMIQAGEIDDSLSITTIYLFKQWQAGQSETARQ